MMQRQFQTTRHFGVVIGLLRDRKVFLEDIRQGIALESKITAYSSVALYFLQFMAQ